MTKPQIAAERAAAHASGALEHLLVAIPADKTQFAKDVREMIDQIDKEFNLHVIEVHPELE